MKKAVLIILLILPASNCYAWPFRIFRRQPEVRRPVPQPVQPIEPEPEPKEKEKPPEIFVI